MKNSIKGSGIAVIAAIALAFILALPEARCESLTQPFPKPALKEGKRWRIGYVEGGAYRDYQEVLKAVVRGLMDGGWIEDRPFPASENDKETGTLWRWLALGAPGDFLEFVPDAYWSSGWDRSRHKKSADHITDRLNKRKDIDLMLVFGTLAGKSMATDAHKVPVLVCSVSDPVGSGIIASAEGSGLAHVHAQVDPEKHKRQVRLFHEIVGFKKLGVAYRDTPEGKTYAAIEDVRRVGRELGFSVVECGVPQEEPQDLERDTETLLDCHERLAAEVDAFYLTLNNIVTPANIPQLIAPFNRRKAPTFAQGRTGEVRYGVLMSMAQVSFRGVGAFHAEILARILKGESPGNLPLVYEEPPALAVNLAAAGRIGFHFPIEVLSAAQEVHERITPPNER